MSTVSTVLLALLPLALAEAPDEAFEPVTPEVEMAQKAWLDYANAASAKVWDVLLKDLAGVELKTDHTYSLSAQLVVDRTGELVEVTLDPPTGHAELDARFTKAFETVGAFGPPPEVWVQETGEAVFRIGFTLDQHVPPEGVVRIPKRD